MSTQPINYSNFQLDGWDIMGVPPPVVQQAINDIVTEAFGEPGATGVPIGIQDAFKAAAANMLNAQNAMKDAGLAAP